MAAIRTQYQARSVVYLLGELDTDPNHPSLDRSCAAKLQGAQRLQRGTAFYNYLGRYYGPGVYERHLLAVVPGVGHSGQAMLTSELGRSHLFDAPTSPPPSPGAAGAPTITGVTPAPARVTVTYSPPASDGGSPIVKYRVTCGSSGQSDTFAEDTVAPFEAITVTGLTPGTTYVCSVRASNAVGDGPESSGVPATVPANQTAPTVGPSGERSADRDNWSHGRVVRAHP